uniref:Homeobox domain-containing protein n=1 Tax=Parastrongyloides trichosuri TaxID=131310 RepID=A0A0N4Z7E0_PARTI
MNFNTEQNLNNINTLLNQVSSAPSLHNNAILLQNSIMNPSLVFQSIPNNFSTNTNLELGNILNSRLFDNSTNCNQLNINQRQNSIFYNSNQPIISEINSLNRNTLNQNSNNGNSVTETNIFPPISNVPFFGNEMIEKVNFDISYSKEKNGHDLPFNDITSLRYFFNLGIQHFSCLRTSTTNFQPPLNSCGADNSQLNSLIRMSNSNDNEGALTSNSILNDRKIFQNNNNDNNRMIMTTSSQQEQRHMVNFFPGNSVNAHHHQQKTNANEPFINSFQQKSIQSSQKEIVYHNKNGNNMKKELEFSKIVTQMSNNKIIVNNKDNDGERKQNVNLPIFGMSLPTNSSTQSDKSSNCLPGFIVNRINFIVNNIIDETNMNDFSLESKNIINDKYDTSIRMTERVFDNEMTTKDSDDDIQITSDQDTNKTNLLKRERTYCSEILDSEEVDNEILSINKSTPSKKRKICSLNESINTNNILEVESNLEGKYGSLTKFMQFIRKKNYDLSSLLTTIIENILNCFKGETTIKLEYIKNSIFLHNYLFYIQNEYRRQNKKNNDLLNVNSSTQINDFIKNFINTSSNFDPRNNNSLNVITTNIDNIMNNISISNNILANQRQSNVLDIPTNINHLLTIPKIMMKQNEQLLPPINSSIDSRIAYQRTTQLEELLSKNTLR